MNTIGLSFRAKGNNFDLLRIVAALMVLTSHSFALSNKASDDPLLRLGYDSGGGWGVAIFFVISGFLVTRSAIERNAHDYLKSRVLRILPALFVVSLFEIIVIGPRHTTLPLSEYLTQSRTWLHLCNGLVFGIDFSLPGVFENNPVKAVVNGSLWTLPIECSFYIILPLLAAVGLLERNRFLLIAIAVGAAYLFGVTKLGWTWERQGGLLFVGVPYLAAAKNAIFFTLGGCLWGYRDKIPMDSGLAACCLLLLAIAAFNEAKWTVFFLTLPYLTIYAGLSHSITPRAYEKLGDLSYGTYIYAFPVQQAVVENFGTAIGPYMLTLIATPITLLLAGLSWHFVEKRALSMRRKIPQTPPAVV